MKVTREMWFDGEAKVRRGNRRDWAKVVVCVGALLIFLALYSWSQQPHTGYEKDAEIVRVQGLRDCGELQSIFDESVGYHQYFVKHRDGDDGGRNNWDSAQFHMARLTAADDRMQDIGCYNR